MKCNLIIRLFRKVLLDKFFDFLVELCLDLNRMICLIFEFAVPIFSHMVTLQQEISNFLFEQKREDPSFIGWLVLSRIYVASAVFQPYRDLEARDSQSEIQLARRGIELGPLAPQAKSLTTRPPPLQTQVEA